MKFDQLIKYPKRNIFFKNYAENEAGKLAPCPFLFFLKSFILGKSKWSAARFHYIPIALT